MGLLEPITHKKEIEELLNSAQYMYNESKSKFEKQKEDTAKELEQLGQVKLDSWANEMNKFTTNFSCFNNLELIQKDTTTLVFNGKEIEPEKMMININQASMNSKEIMKTEAFALGSGALIGIASYGGVALFAKASTGTAIATLNGAAKTNAILSFFGGGAKAVGGLGKIGGKFVLAGITVAPVLIVAGLIAGARGKAKLEEAKKIHSEAKDKSEKLNIMTTGMNGIEILSSNYQKFIKNFNQKFQPFIDELEKIKNKYNGTEDNQIDYNILTLSEKKTLHITWLMAQLYYNILSATIITDDGNKSIDAENTLQQANKSLDSIKRETSKLRGEEAKVANILWNDSASKMLRINLTFSIIMLLIGIVNFENSILDSLIYITSALIAFPIFIKYRNLSKSQFCFWRKIRLISAIIFIIIFKIML